MEEDEYLATDDEGDDDAVSSHRSLSQRRETEAIQRAELARARKLVSRRVNEHELKETSRVFSMLDNVSEKEPCSFGYGLHGRERRAGLDPSRNQFIDNEAIEVGDDDSDIAADEAAGVEDGENSFIANSDSEDEDSSSPPPKRHRKAVANKGVTDRTPLGRAACGSSDLGSSYSSDEEVVYDDICVSREAMLRSISAAEETGDRRGSVDSDASQGESYFSGSDEELLGTKKEKTLAEFHTSSDSDSGGEEEEEGEDADDPVHPFAWDF